MSLLLNPVFILYTNLYNNISVILSYVWINNELLIPTVSFLYVFNQAFVVELVSKLDIWNLIIKINVSMNLYEAHCSLLGQEIACTFFIAHESQAIDAL